MVNVEFVDEADKVIGAGPVAQAWEDGTRHRIVRIFVVNQKGEVLLARRGVTLRSLPGRWNESAAGHVDEGEDYADAAPRELQEELGVSDVPLKEIAYFKSEETDEPDKKKNRWTKVYAVRSDGPFIPDPIEVAETKWVSPKALSAWIDRAPNDFTEGCILGFRELVKSGEVKV